MEAIHLRILGYITTFLLHMVNMTLLQLKRDEELAKDLRIQLFRNMMFRYFTCWTIGLQITYAVLGLYCDLSTLINAKKKNYEVWKPLRGVRNVMFASLVWPSSMVVFTVFWTLFLYDRSLIFPEFIDKVLSSTSNHILHTAIFPIALWEVIFRARSEPRSHVKNFVHLGAYAFVYLSMFFHTYYTYGIFLYPIFQVTYGSIKFLYLHLWLGALFVIFYFMQWWINSAVHGDVEKKKIK